MMILSELEVITLYSYFQRSPWIDRDWELGEEIHSLINRVTKNYEGDDLMAGVAFNAPTSLDLQKAIHSSVKVYFDELESSGKTGGVFAVVTKDANGTYANAVVATKIGNHVEIAGYIGKKWGNELVAGAEGKVMW